MAAQAKWIWADVSRNSDQHCNFYVPFSYASGPVQLKISADSNYAVWVNGKLANSGQYPDYPHYKVFDSLELADLCVPGENHLAISVWYYGKSNFSYYPGVPGLLYELRIGEETVLCSGADTLSRLDPCYENGRQKKITGQLGFGFAYDLTREDSWKTGCLKGFSKSIVQKQNPELFPRPVEKCAILPFLPGKIVGGNGSDHFLLDLGREEVGFLQFRLKSSCQQKLLVAYGEHILDGGVRRIIKYRDFSVEFTLREGENLFTDPFRRFGCRYLEFFTDSPVELVDAGLLPVEYPLTVTGKAPENPLWKQIYDVSVRTLQLCMHDHYEDTPWREQGLYAMDSRNQMLCGYYAFSEYRFPRANLLLMSKCRREDSLLDICFPTGSKLTIPSFSLHYFTQVWEYTQYSGDLTLAREIYSRLQQLLSIFLTRMDSGLVPTWEGKDYWNFYEWEKGLDGTLGTAESSCFDAPLNCLFSLALQRMGNIARALSEEDLYTGLVEPLNRKIRQHFFDDKAKAFRNSEKDPHFSQLVNALAILCGAAEEDSASIAQALADPDSDWTPATLSMRCFVYDALLMVDKDKYRSHILSDIETRYQTMLDAGATSFWETEKGAGSFDEAGSLSHGWSAMPVYYYGILL